jgi:hypothetical protein
MSHLITGNTVDRFILREYIGVKPYPKSFIFPDIDYNEIDFHVILAFAHETYNEDGKGTGKFYPDWDLDICGIPRVQDIKLKYPKVKVVLSIGGRDIQSVQDIIKHKDIPPTKYPFSPIEKESWCDNAVDSLKKIIQDYTFDGIDILYDNINTNEEDFSNYVGDVIKRLKEEVGINVVSIAPSHETNEHYKLLYRDHSDDINWVNYQFYMQPNPTDETDFVDLIYVRLARECYTFEKLLVGASTDPRDGRNVPLPLDVFVASCSDLMKVQRSGIFIWNANDYEKIARDIITTIPRNN